MANGNANALGKLTEDIRTRVDPATRDEFSRLACEAGMGVSEFLRDLIMVRVHGLDRVARLHRSRLALVAGCGPDVDE